LGIIKDRELKDITIVDNSIISFAFHLDNGIPIEDYHRDIEKDEELLYLTSYLKDLFAQDDIRTMNAKKFRLNEFSKS
jgi:TFIIF-interacting CTD phosphatase-like protein